MDEIKYIDDPRGGRIPLTDTYGNLTVDALFLYNKDLLSAEGKALMDEILANDEMARDALEGYTIMANGKDAKVAVAAINSSLGTDKNEVVTPVIKLDYKRFAAAAAILVLVGIGGFIGIKFISQNQLADNAVDSAEHSKEQIPSDQIKFEADEELGGRDVQYDLNENESTLEKDAEQANSQLSQTEKPEEETRSASSVKADSSFDIPKTERDKNQIEDSKNREELLGKLANLKEQKSELTDSYRNQNETKYLETVSGNASVPEDELAAAPSQEPVALQQGIDSGESPELQAEREREEFSRMADEATFSKRLIKAKQASESVNNASADLDQIEEVPDAETVYSAKQVDQLPRFPGGDLAMFKFIENRKIHPPNLEAQGIEGEVFVSFQLDGNGNVTNVKPLRADNSQMEADAIRVIRSMPQWQAAKKGGYPVKVKKTVLIKYTIKE